MLDVQLIRSNLEEVATRLATRGSTIDVAAVRTLEKKPKHAQVRTQELQARRNASSKQIGELKRKGGDSSVLMAQMTAVGDELKTIEAGLEAFQFPRTEMLLTIPNLPHASVPVGTSADENVEVRRVGEPRKFAFAVKDDVDVRLGLGLLCLYTASQRR